MQLIYVLFTQDYYQSGRMLVKMAEAIGRIVLAGREMTRLAGYVIYYNGYCGISMLPFIKVKGLSSFRNFYFVFS